MGFMLMALAPPLLVYFTYPETWECEAGLEKVLVDVPVKPPSFLIGSMGYTLYRGRDFVDKLAVRDVNHTITAYRPDRGETVILVLLPYYLERSTGKIVLGEHLRRPILLGNATLMVEVFETHKGRVCIIAEVRLDGEVYTVLRRLRW